MPLQQSIWRLGQSSEKVRVSQINSEKSLEDYIVGDPDILNPNWMLIGRQVKTDYRGYIDLLALQPDGTPVIIELKKDKTPRDVLAQTLDYASWVESLNPSRLQQIYENFLSDLQANLSRDFESRFGTELQDEAMNRDHMMVIVATELDNSTERVVKFLGKRNLNINVLFFQVFEDQHGLLLSRAWLVDPAEVQVSASSAGSSQGAWNGEYYVSFGEDEVRRWDDAVKYGFITASGGPWYTQTLSMLALGDRVWVNIPKQGFVGVGRVAGAAVRATEFLVQTENQSELLVAIPEMSKYATHESPETEAWFVPISWEYTVSAREAVREPGFFGNQNTVAKPKSEKWEHTVQVLKKKFNQI